MNPILPVTLAAMLLAPWSLAAQEVDSRTYTASDGSIVLVHTIEVPASRVETWRAFTTSEGLMTWAAPFARVDFRLGGIWESSYDPEAAAGAPGNIRTRYLGFVPERMLTIQAVEAPPNFPHPEILPDLFSVVQLEGAGEGRTRVTMYGVGYRDTPAHRAILDMFREANAWTLTMLHKRFAEGPVDWDAALGTGGGS